MLIQIDDKIISSEIFGRKFVCDLNACKGACCVEGDAGAPLAFDEIDTLEDVYESVKPFMRPEGIAAVEEQGVFYIDQFNHPAVTLVNNAECAFVYFDEKGITKCAIEQAYFAGEISWKKPISCHLYPIRESKLSDGIALNYDEWKICAPACACGEKFNVPVYRFLKEPIIRAYGEEFFHDLEVVDREIHDSTELQ